MATRITSCVGALVAGSLGTLGSVAPGCAASVDTTTFYVAPDGGPAGGTGGVGGFGTGGTGVGGSGVAGTGGYAAGGTSGAGASGGSGGAYGGAAGVGGSGTAGTGAVAGSGGSTTTVPGGGTGFTSPMEMFGWINATRQQYTSHDPYDGYPWKGAYVTKRTWAVTFTWDDALAAEAQGRADALAGGAQPTGQKVNFTNALGAPGEPMWLSGLDTAKYTVIAASDATLKGPASKPNSPFKWHLVENGSYRQGIAYQTGTGATNQKTKLGVGMTDQDANVTWWVLVFGE